MVRAAAAAAATVEASLVKASWSSRLVWKFLADTAARAVPSSTAVGLVLGPLFRRGREGD